MNNPFRRPVARRRAEARLRLEALEPRFLLSGGVETATSLAPLTVGSVTAVELGTLEYRERALSAGAAAWFHFTAARDATFTALVQGGAGASAARLSLFDPDGEGTLWSLKTAEDRMDRSVKAGRDYYLRVEGAEAGETLVLADLFVRSGALVTVYGTAHGDRFELVCQSSGPVKINSVEYALEGNILRVNFDGRGGQDAATLTGSAADEVFQLFPRRAVVLAPGFKATAAHTEQITAIAGGGADVASFADSGGDDALRVSPGEAAMSGPGFSNRATGFPTVLAAAQAGGYDTARLTGSDGNDRFNGRPERGALAGPGFYFRADLFDAVYAEGGPGDDVAQLYGSSGRDLFEAGPLEGTLSGSGFSNTAAGFENINARSGGGVDTAQWTDSPGDDFFVGEPRKASLFGAGYTLRAQGFNLVEAAARAGGYDVAQLHDSPGDDVLAGTPQSARLSGAGFALEVDAFDAVYTYARAGGFDAARLRDSPGNDSFVGRPEYARLEGDGFALRVEGFGNVVAAASSGGDDAALLIHSADTDVLQAGADWARLSGPQSGFSNEAQGFDRVTVRLGSEDAAEGAAAGNPAFSIERPTVGVELNAADFFDPLSPTLGIQDAIDALPAQGGVVNIPAGTWVLRQGLVLRSGVNLRGAGSATVLMCPPRVQARLTRPAQPGDTMVEVASTEGFHAGDEVSLFGYGAEAPAHMVIAQVLPGQLLLAQPIAASAAFTLEQEAAVVNLFALVRASWRQEAKPVDGVTVENLLLDGNLDESTWSWRVAAPSVVHLANASNSVVRNVTVRRSSSSGITLEYGHDNLVENSLVEQSRDNGIYLEQESDSVVRNNTVRYAGYGVRNTTWGEGILLNGGYDVRVEGNLVEYSLGHGLHPAGMLTYGGVWSNNVSRYNGGNGFHFCWDNFGILVTGNQLYGNAQNGIGGLGLGGPVGDRFNVITRNVIRDNGKYGILTNGGMDNVIADNLIVDNSRKALGRFVGVLLSQTSYFEVSGNLIGSSTAAATQKFGIDAATAADYSVIMNNDVRGNREGGIRVGGTTTVVLDNLGTVVALV